jgi:hypothetical protein
MADGIDAGDGAGDGQAEQLDELPDVTVGRVSLIEDAATADDLG